VIGASYSHADILKLDNLYVSCFSVQRDWELTLLPQIDVRKWKTSNPTNRSTQQSSHIFPGVDQVTTGADEQLEQLSLRNKKRVG
jgi:hypothetical protein